jgi:hypothetical protein
LLSKYSIIHRRIKLDLNGFVWIIFETLGAVIFRETLYNVRHKQFSVNVRVWPRIVKADPELQFRLIRRHLVLLLRPSSNLLSLFHRRLARIASIILTVQGQIVLDNARLHHQVIRNPKRMTLFLD